MLRSPTGPNHWADQFVQVRKWFAPPLFSDEVLSRRASLLNIALLISLAFAAGPLLGNLIGGRTPQFIVVSNLVFLGITLILRYWMYQGKVNVSSVLMLSIGFVYITVASAALGTLRTPTPAVYGLIVVAAGILFGRTGILFSTIASSLAVLGLIVAENAGWLPQPDYTVTITQWITYSIFFVATGGITHWTVQSLLRALERARQEIAERRRIDIALSESEQNFATFFNTIDHLLFVLDEQGNILWNNATVTRKLHYNLEELRGQSVLMVHPPARRAEAGQIVADMLAGKADYCPVPVMTKEGDLIPVETRVVQGQWSGRPAIFGVTKDLSALKASEEKFSKAFHSSPALMAISELETGIYIDVNEAFLRILGFARDEVIGHSSFELNLFAVPEERAHALRLIQEQGYLRDFQVVVHGKTGQIVNGLFSAEYIELQDRRVLLTVMNDISERKRAEDALRASEAKFRNFVEQSAEGFTLVDEEGTIIEWNRAREEMTGQRRAQVIGEKFWDVQYRMVAPEERTPELYARRKQMIQDALRTGISPMFDRVIEATIIRTNGERRFIQQSVFPIKSERGYWIGSASHDSTDTKMVQDALRASEERYRELFENLPIPVFTKDLDGRYTSTNPENLKYWNVNPVGHTDAELLPPEIAHLLSQVDRQVVQTLTIQNREEKFSMDDGIHTMLSRKVPLRDSTGSVIGILGASLDITDRKRLEQELRAQEELYRQMFTQHSAVKLLIEPVSGAIVDANPAAAQFYGYSLDRLRQMNINQICTRSPEQNAEARMTVVRQGNGYFILSHRLASGELRDVEMYSVPIEARHQIVLYAIIHDITARRQAEAQLRYLSTHDALTGLYNRAMFESEIARFETGREFPVSMVVADADNMKVTNDTLGHLAGDDLLKRAADLFREVFRASDMIARIGGDEFAILLPQTDADTADQVVARVRSKLLDANVSAVVPPLLLSLGVATAEKDCVLDAFKLADARMYAEKQQHRSR